MSEQNEFNQMPLATEIIHELKANSRRWFIIAVAELAIILAMVAGILWYFSLPVEEYDIQQDAQSSSRNMIVGGNYNGETESYLQEESSSH